jgi:hypothetical protein
VEIGEEKGVFETKIVSTLFFCDQHASISAKIYRVLSIRANQVIHACSASCAELPTLQDTNMHGTRFQKKKKHAWAATSIGVFADVDGKASRPPPEKPSLPIPIYDHIT